MGAHQPPHGQHEIIEARGPGERLSDRQDLPRPADGCSDLIDVEQLVGAIEADLYGVRSALQADHGLRDRVLRALDDPASTDALDPSAQPSGTLTPREKASF